MKAAPPSSASTRPRASGEPAPSSEKSPLVLFRDAFATLSPRRRKQLGLLGALMVVGALAESVTLGAVVPFIALITDPERAFDYPRIRAAFSAFGWNKPDQIVLPMTLVFMALVLVSMGIRLVLAWVSKRFSYAVGRDLGFGIYKRILYQPYSFHARRNSSDVLGAINKAQAVATGVLMPSIQALSAAAMSIGILTALLLIDAGLALAAGAIFTSLYILVSRLVRARLRKNGRIIAAAQSARIRYVQEGLGGIRDVILDGLQPWYLEKFRKMEERFRTAQAQNAFVGESPRHVIEAIGILLIVSLAYGFTMAEGGVISALPVLGAMALGAQRLLPQGQQLYAAWTQVSGNHQMLTDVRGFLELPLPEPEASSRTAKRLEFNNSIRFDNVGFRYYGQQCDVLTNLNLEIHKGEKIGIAGRTGSGKSTLMDLMMGLLEPTEGRILIDGVLLDQSNRPNWRAQIAHVPQFIYLSDASIAENIAFGMAPEDIDMDGVRRCAQRAQLSEFVETLEDGYQTTVGERGARLSGGQRQRIGIARALYKNAKVLVLDEATNALDSQTEQAVTETVHNMGRDLTVFIISHRESSLAICDRFIQLETLTRPQEQS